jgi:hypothetical protein
MLPCRNGGIRFWTYIQSIEKKVEMETKFSIEALTGGLQK